MIVYREVLLCFLHISRSEGYLDFMGRVLPKRRVIRRVGTEVHYRESPAVGHCSTSRPSRGIAWGERA